MKIAAIILAAGGSTRFGRPKQLLELEGETLVHRACRVAREAGCDPVVLVLGPHARLILEAGLPDKTTVLENPRWQEGMGCSLALGAARLKDEDAVIVMLADQPGVTTETIGRLMTRFGQGNASILLCDHQDSPGPPALFAAQHFRELAALTGDEGGRSLVRKHPGALATVPAPEAGWDMDDEKAWQRFRDARGPGHPPP